MNCPRTIEDNLQADAILVCDKKRYGCVPRGVKSRQAGGLGGLCSEGVS